MREIREYLWFLKVFFYKLCTDTVTFICQGGIPKKLENEMISDVGICLFQLPYVVMQRASLS